MKTLDIQTKLLVEAFDFDDENITDEADIAEDFYQADTDVWVPDNEVIPLLKEFLNGRKDRMYIGRDVLQNLQDCLEVITRKNGNGETIRVLAITDEFPEINGSSSSHDGFYLNMTDIDAWYFFEFIEMCNIEKLNPIEELPVYIKLTHKGTGNVLRIPECLKEALLIFEDYTEGMSLDIHVPNKNIALLYQGLGGFGPIYKSTKIGGANFIIK